MKRISANKKIVTAVENNSPFVFISSLVFEISQLRRDINDINNENDEYLPVYVDEEYWDAKMDGTPYTMDRLLNTMDKSQSVIVILTTTELRNRESKISASRPMIADTGTLIKLENLGEVNDITGVSFWEIELFKLALSGKPVCFIARQDFRPGPHLLQFFEMVPWMLPQIVKTHSDEELLSIVRMKCRTKITVRNRVSAFSLSNFHHALKKWKENSSYTDSFIKQINWGIKNQQHFCLEPNIDIIENIVNDDLNEKMFGSKLSYLWLAYRELYRLPYNHDKYKEFLPLWNSFFNKWADAAAWYGIHSSFIDLGVMPVLAKMELVRTKLRSHSNWQNKPEEVEYPARHFASELYSQSRLYQSSSLLNKSLFEVEQGISMKNHDIDELLAIKGSIYFMKCNLRKAISCYSDVLRLREKSGFSKAKIGEAMTELGFALAFTIVGYSRGKKMIEEGLALMENNGFKVRALRKLKKITFNPVQRRLIDEFALEVGRDCGAQDQLRQIGIKRL